MSFNNSFVQAFAPSYRDSVGAIAAIQQMKQQAALQEQARQNEMERQIADAAAQYGVAPVIDPATKRINILATAVATKKAADLHDRIQAIARAKDGRDFATWDKANDLGLNPGPLPMPSDTPNQPAAPAAPAALPVKNYMALPGQNVDGSATPPPSQPGAFAAPPPPAAAPAPQQPTLEMQIMAKQNAIKLAQDRLKLQQAAQEDLAKRGVAVGARPQPSDYDENGLLTDAYAARVNDAETSLKRQQNRNAVLSTAQDNMATKYPDLKPGTPEYNDAINREKFYLTATPQYKNAINQADGLVSTGVIPKNDSKAWRAEVDRIASFGGLPPRLDPSQQNTLTGDNALLAGIQSLQDQIRRFNQANPQQPFSSYVGPVDKKTLQFNLAVNSNARPQAKEAGRIMQFYQSLLNRKLKDQSGTAVTANEMARQLLESGSLDSNNFENAINGFGDAVANQYQNRLQALASYAVPDSLKTVNGKSPGDYIGAWKNQGAAAANPADDILKKYGIQ